MTQSTPPDPPPYDAFSGEKTAPYPSMSQPPSQPPGGYYGQPAVPTVPYGTPAYPYGGFDHGSAGRIRGTGTCILLTIVTLGFYPLYWYYVVHTEMQRHSGQGIGGGVALLLAFFIGFVSPFIASSEVGALYARAGLRPPVSGATGLWYVPGFLILIGPLVWFVKTNGALNAYWRTRGVV